MYYLVIVERPANGGEPFGVSIARGATKAAARNVHYALAHELDSGQTFFSGESWHTSYADAQTAAHEYGVTGKVPVVGMDGTRTVVRDVVTIARDERDERMHANGLAYAEGV